jgi:hypothetical protein|tara:strand:+ start:1170 stop:1772 length:603 start_codon:yes stop_codon:yes gene_type:complete
MKHPFDDFLPSSYHTLREDRRVIHIGIVLVAVVSIATAVAFTSSLSGWRSLLLNRESVATRWDDAGTRTLAFVKAQKTMKDAVEQAVVIEQFVDTVPRSIILWEVTQSLPEASKLHDIRLETRKRTIDEDLEEVTELITLIGMASSDANISSYIESLSTCGKFQNVSLMYAQQEGNSTKRNFSIQFEVQRNSVLVMEDSQ